MIWKDCDLQKQVGQQTDELGNLVGGEWQTIMATCARQTPWTNINTESGDRSRFLSIISLMQRTP